MCGACCTNFGQNQSVLLLKDDISAIAHKEKATIERIAEKYCEINHDLSVRAGITILQLKSSRGTCIFLDEHKKCSIHAYKPTQCRIGPDRFLPDAMSEVYECMVGVVTSRDDDLTEIFFSRLMED